MMLSIAFLDNINRSQLLLLATVPFLLGVGLYFWFWIKSKTTGKAELRWIGMVPLVIGLILGYFPFSNVRDTLYRQFNDIGARSELLHYVAFFAPIVGIIIVLVADVFLKRMQPKAGL